MTPDSMGTIGSTHGVKASSRPNPKKLATVSQKPPAKTPAIRASSAPGRARSGAGNGCGRRAHCRTAGGGELQLRLLLVRDVAHADVGAALRDGASA